jgi:RNA-directed DNA polymerase
MKYDKTFVNFSPAVSDEATKAMRREIRRWKLHLRSDKTLRDLARMFNIVVQGWINYYGRYYPSMLRQMLRSIDRFLVRWARRKYKRLTIHYRRNQGRNEWRGRWNSNPRLSAWESDAAQSIDVSRCLPMA